MARIKITDLQEKEPILRSALETTANTKQHRRLQGLLLISKGMTYHHAANQLGQHPSTLSRWVQRFQTDGLNGLVDGERSGRPRRLSSGQWEELAVDLQRSPRDFGYEGNSWDGKLVSTHVQGKFQIALGVRQCQRLLKKLMPQFSKAA